MIVILSDTRFDARSGEIKSALEAKFAGLPVEIVDSSQPRLWTQLETWSDALVVPFDGAPLSSDGLKFVEAALRRSPPPFILPVATIPSARVPPAPLDGIKALPFDADGFARGCARIGARLGLALRSRDHTIFISYRAVDGTSLAAQFENYLKSEGYNVWRDDARDDFDGQTSIRPGEPVQQQIEANLSRADLVLLLDTPRASESEWINIEISLANGNLIPVLPVLFRRRNERVLCSRFRMLDTLQRTVALDLPGSDAPPSVDQSFLERVLTEMEAFLCEIFQRRLSLPLQVRNAFLADNYDWNQRDRFVYEALKKSQGRLVHRVFSHCSPFDGVYDPALRTFVQHFRGIDPRANYALYVYDGLVIPPAQLRQIERAAELVNSTEVILLHHSEVLAVLKSNFANRP